MTDTVNGKHLFFDSYLFILQTHLGSTNKVYEKYCRLDRSMRKLISLGFLYDHLN